MYRRVPSDSYRVAFTRGSVRSLNFDGKWLRSVSEFWATGWWQPKQPALSLLERPEPLG